MSDTLEFFKKPELLFQNYQERKYANLLAVAENLAAEYPERMLERSLNFLCYAEKENA